MKNPKIRVVIADGHRVYRAGIQTLLRGFNDLEVVGEASNGEMLLEKFDALVPDVVLTDYSLPTVDGLQATMAILAKDPHARILALSQDDHEEAIMGMLDAGALGFLSKHADQVEIAEAIFTAYQRKPYFCKRIADKLTQLHVNRVQKPRTPRIFFSEKEQSIMRMICNELTSKEIAYELKMSKRTIEGLRTRIMEKIGAKSIAGVITYSVFNGIFAKAS